ncbi:hypothetical protein Tco_1565823, partial [Tanacetum coccineum]
MDNLICSKVLRWMWEYLLNVSFGFEKRVEVFQFEVVLLEFQKHLFVKYRVWVGVQGVLLNLHPQVLGYAPTVLT